MAPAGYERHPQELRGERSVVFVGTERGMEAKLVPQAGLPLELIRVAGLKGIGGMKLLRNAAMLPAGLLGLRKNYSAAIVFARRLGVGGYASGPMMLAAVLHRIPTVIFEPNVEPGFTNRVLAGMATRVAVGAQETADALRRKAVVTGCPVRKEFFADPAKRSIAQRLSRILITGGSRGALPINRAVIDSLDRLPREKISFSSCIRLVNATIMRFA